ncbi:771a2d65-5aab-4476-b9b5-ec5e31617f89 [Thermothielavioides terrestris]|uniref:771a2d65-5aab-4476-b9b5-ec5e31617f89 n=1 Tax=Thermothielavioides terrestris TaxID=2587410 RepID=A0A446BTM7_9PEZI|nr:771a2d65-5aab-4476-b9b5-ec5e31617f89 [Thermothielavioides terrestris]
MKVNEDAIKPVGLTLLYEPDWPIDPAVDVVLVHGIGGHPVRSWKCQSQEQALAATQTTVSHPGIKRRLTKRQPTALLRRSNSEPLLPRDQRAGSSARTPLGNLSAKSASRLNLDISAEPTRQGSLSRSRSLLRKISVKSASRLKLAVLAEPAGQRHLQDGAYWPLDFFPASCPNARLFTWGYHTLVTGTKPLPLQADIFSHAKELLVELAGVRSALGAGARPIVFVAHSTGGVLVKDLLRLSEAEHDGPLKEILLSTSAVIFLGSPHRGTEHCKLGDAIRSMASVTLPGDPDDPALQELCGANSVAVELGRQAFVRLWNEYNFKVKTFQESVIPSYQHPEIRAETTIRRLASFIGDPREDAETIYALHADICRFGSAEDAGYRALMKTLTAIICKEEDARHVLNTKETECLSVLVQPQPALPETHPATSYPGTCLWLYDLHDFKAWHHRDGPNKHKILWIRGESGCGKTILLRSLRRRLERQWGPAGAAFIWCAAQACNGTDVPLAGHYHVSPAGVYRDLLAQLFLLDPRLRKALLALYNQPRSDPRTFDDAQVVSFFADYYVNQKIETPVRRTFIIVEIADEACPAYVNELLNRLSRLARNSDFSICVASGYRQEIIEEENLISIPMHLRNTDDILRYVNLNLLAEWEERDSAVMTIGRKARGVFLWAEIMVNILNAAIIEGATQEMIEYTLDEVPDDLHGLYEWMLSTLNDRERAESLLLFQWVMLAAEPMRLNDLFLAVRLTDADPFALYRKHGPLMALDIGMPLSMRELRQLRNSEINSDTPDQFHRFLRARSIGLLELKSDSHQSAANEPLGLQRVQPIHSSVRTFFLSGRGFACLAAGNPSIPANLPVTDFIDITHYAMLRACLTYLNMRDFESLGHGASRRRKPTSSQALFPLSPLKPTATTPPSLSPLQQQQPRWHPHHPQLISYSSSRTTTTISSNPTASTHHQRHLILTSYPFLPYAVTHLLFHLLSPTRFRYFFPQRALLAALAADGFRLWKRWTSLLGAADPDAIVAMHAAPGARAAPLLSPVFGARFRLERVLRKLARLAQARRTLAAAATSAASAATDVGTAHNAIAQQLRDTGVWAYLRGRRRGKNTDKYRVNVVSEELCDDILNYIKPTMARHEGCDILDIFPGVGVWSRKLNDLLKPRSHLLLEPDEEYYRPFLQPLLERPGTQLLPESGIVWEQLNKILNPTYLPHQVERRYSADETPERNDTLLVTMNLSMHPKRKFRSFDSLAQLVLFQVIASIRPASLFHKYGLVRMLLWIPDQEKGAIMPRTVQRRKKMAIEAEISTDYVCEVAGAEVVDSGSGRGQWYRRDSGMDLYSTAQTLERMRRGGFVMPPGREPEHLLEFLKQNGAVPSDDELAYGQERAAYTAELHELETAQAEGRLQQGSAAYARLKALQYWVKWSVKRTGKIGNILRERHEIVQAFVNAGSDQALLERAAKMGEDWCKKVDSLDRSMRADVLLQRDNMHILYQDPPVMNWDRRYVEPLRVRAHEFYPAVPSALLDIQPKAAARVLRDIGPRSTRGGDTFDLVLRSLSQRGSEPITKALNTIFPGAGDGVFPYCPSLADPAAGGSPIRDVGEVTTRSMNERQFVEIAERWMQWPFRPTYAELVSRTVEDFSDDIEESPSGNSMSPNVD